MRLCNMFAGNHGQALGHRGQKLARMYHLNKTIVKNLEALGYGD